MQTGLVDGSVTDLTTERWRKIMLGTLDSAFWACKYAIPEMTRAGGGAIVNIASSAATRGWAGIDAYTAAGQLVGRCDRGHVHVRVLGWLRRQLSQAALDFLPHSPERDAEYALAALEEIYDLIGRRAGVHADAIAHQGHLGQVGVPALTEELHRGADLLQ